MLPVSGGWQTLGSEFTRVEAAFAAAEAHQLSTRKTLLAAVLIDNFCDQAFEALRNMVPTRVFCSEDVLAFRARLREESPALALIFDLCASPSGGPRLKIQAIEVPISKYHELSIEDYMVSLYNRNTVQRVLIALPDGRTRLAHEVLEEAIAWWRDFKLC